jgi:two-component system sensor histidine kinase HydH
VGTSADQQRVWKRTRGLVRAQDAVWILLFAALAFFGPDRNPATISLLAGLAVFQVVEPKIRYFASPQGSAVSFGIKLVLCYLLIGWTDGIASSYYWILLLPVISAATSLGLIGTLIATAVAFGAYFSFLLFLAPGQVIEPDQVRELVLRAIILPVVGFLTNQLAQASRSAAREYQAVAEQLAEANVSLQAAEAAMRRSERLAALGQMSAGLAHELRNPMGTMRSSAELLMKNIEPSNELALEMATFIISEVDRSNSLITRFLDFARPLKLKRVTTELTQVIDRAVQQMEWHKPPFDVAIYKNYSPDIRPFPMDGELMELVIYNLILNAVQASPPRGTVTVKTRQIEDMVEIAVIDSGSGIDAKHLENIFNPFFTTKPTGVGLGLAIVSKIVDEHGGKISVDSEPGNGSVFRVYLPAEEREG